MFIFLCKVSKERIGLHIQLMRYVDVRIASPHNCFGIFNMNNKFELRQKGFFSFVQLPYFVGKCQHKSFNGLSHDFKDNIVRYA